MGDDEMLERLGTRLVEEGYDFEGLPLVFHLPIVEVNGVLIGRPTIREIWENLDYGDGLSPRERRKWSWSLSPYGTGVSSRAIRPE